ncbi:DNA cytosine methyltransferase [Veillonella infantium]|uniref:DNA (cytosine-5-)-methyltransferase n=1 Tax=Veillonella infantium TaxID=1911679 RepID=A0ABX5C5L8_9FIRM|nr:DNA cytosine methyltransferase [Veillonella infantium]PQL58606.1 restriction endonuclease subunit M [Veillonella infantium]
MNKKFSVGSICSGIEAASVAWKNLNLKFEWFSEIAKFPSALLAEKYPEICNVGDMNNIPQLLEAHDIALPDIICGGTPCQAFSLAGLRNGLDDERGNLTLKFVDIVNKNDELRIRQGLPRAAVLWENVEGVLRDKTNAFGSFIAYLAGLDDVLCVKHHKWPSAGVLRGRKRNVAWRIIDARFYGLAQQRKRLYVIATDKSINPENILFEIQKTIKNTIEKPPELRFKKNGSTFEVFREYTDCLYSAYGTKWNGNAAAYNGSLFVVQNERIRRLSPLECERLMGFPDGYTDINGARKTNRYQGLGNSWAVPVIEWIGTRLVKELKLKKESIFNNIDISNYDISLNNEYSFFSFTNEYIELDNNYFINYGTKKGECEYTYLPEIISDDAPEDIYISPVGCFGILRRKMERNIKINNRLEKVLFSIASQMTPEEIDKRSRVQKRGVLGTSHVLKHGDIMSFPDKFNCVQDSLFNSVTTKKI